MFLSQPVSYINLEKREHDFKFQAAPSTVLTKEWVFNRYFLNRSKSWSLTSYLYLQISHHVPLCSSNLQCFLYLLYDLQPFLDLFLSFSSLKM